MLNLMNLAALVQTMAAAAQGACSLLLDYTVGSVLRAITQSVAAMGLWLQWLLVQLANRIRLSTSSGSDVDSFVNDFDLERLPGTASSGQVTLARFYATTAATILATETFVKTGDGSQTFVIVADSTNSLWNAGLTDPTGNVVGGFVIPIGTLSANFAVQNTVAGSAGNVAAGTITLLASGIPGIDTCTNASAFTNGLDAETDPAVKGRFVNYIGSLSKATLLAILSAVQGVQQGLTVDIAENVNGAGSYQPGNFVVTVDDGSGDPPSGLLANVSTAVNQVRGLTIMFNVQGPNVTNVAIVLTISAAAGYTAANLQGPVATAIQAYVNSLPVGASLPYSRVSQVAYNASPGITNVSSMTVNGATADITVTASGVIKCSPPPVVNI